MSQFIEIQNLGINCKFDKEDSVLEVLNKNKIEIDQSCGGMGSCGTCRVFIYDDRLPERNEIEQERADALGFSSHERLACQISPLDKMKIEIPNSFDD